MSEASRLCHQRKSFIWIEYRFRCWRTFSWRGFRWLLVTFFAVTILPSFPAIGCITERFHIIYIGKSALIMINISSGSWLISKLGIQSLIFKRTPSTLIAQYLARGRGKKNNCIKSGLWRWFNIVWLGSWGDFEFHFWHRLPEIVLVVCSQHLSLASELNIYYVKISQGSSQSLTLTHHAASNNSGESFMFKFHYLCYSFKRIQRKNWKNKSNLFLFI